MMQYYYRVEERSISSTLCIKKDYTNRRVAEMKFLDEVKVINNNYAKYGITEGMIGTIIDADIRWDTFYVSFEDQRLYDKEFMKIKENIFHLNKDICIGVKISDLTVLKESKIGNKEILENLPEKHKNTWCKVENGFILNLSGERKNKIAYKYDS